MDISFAEFLELFGAVVENKTQSAKQAKPMSVLGRRWGGVGWGGGGWGWWYRRSYVFRSISKPGIGSFIFKFPILSFQLHLYLKHGGHIEPGR